MPGFRPCVLVCLALVALAGCGRRSHHTRTSAPAATAPTVTASRPGAIRRSADWPTYHRDLARSGYDPDAPALRRIRREWSAPVDGKVYAEPLVVGGRVVVATENNSLYALDRRTGKVEWRRHLGAPVAGGSLPCGNIDPSGITGTPAIDTARGLVYAVGFLQPAHHELFALDLNSGAARWSRPIDPPGADPRVHQQRAALALASGRVYVAYGGLFGDCGAYRGWLLAASTTSAGRHVTTFRVPAQREAGIWAPSGPAIDRPGNVYLTTGNASTSSSGDLGNAVISLTRSLRRRGFFQPTDAAALNASDTDLGSVGPELVSRGRIFAIGKSGTGFLLDSRRLGGVGGDIASHPVCRGPAFGGAAYAAPRLFVPCVGGLQALTVSHGGFDVGPSGPGFRAGPPIVAGGAVWTVDLDSAILYGLDIRSLRPRAQLPLGEVAQFTTPAESRGIIYVGAGAKVIAVGGV